MAKRKRLTPALPGTHQSISPMLDTDIGHAPIARVSRETASEAAFAEVAEALASARSEGRLIVKLALNMIETGHLVRDRIAFAPDDMAALKASLQARGQQVPIEVVALDQEGRFGLISGLRRVMALRDIGATDVLALVRQPENSAAAYLAMVEENEIRVGVSFYERARVAAEAAKLGLYDSPHVAISALFQQASPAKRSKIGSFVVVYDALDDVLAYPAAIPERLGLAMAKALAHGFGFASQLNKVLAQSAPQTAEQERALIDQVLRKRDSKQEKSGAKSQPSPEIAPGVFLARKKGQIVLSGPSVTKDLEDALIAWMAEQR
jgi:ParB family chromosome partitioning protein